MSDFSTLTAESLHNAAIEAAEFNLVAILKPKIFIDGDKYCVLYGDDLQQGIAGFGDTPTLAVYDFNKAWHAKVRQGGAE